MRKAFLKVLGRSLTLNFLIFLSLLSLHEMGHALTAFLLGCDVKAIIFDSNTPNPYTEVSCERDVGMIALGGLMFTLPLAFLFRVFGTKERPFFYVILGLSLFLGSLDISLLFSLGSLKYFFILGGMGLMVYGEYRLGWLIGEETYKSIKLI